MPKPSRHDSGSDNGAPVSDLLRESSVKRHGSPSLRKQQRIQRQHRREDKGLCYNAKSGKEGNGISESPGTTLKWVAALVFFIFLVCCLI